jgi:acylaminoacyl-peptidase
VTGMKKHGLVYANGNFGSFQFSADESKLLYIAEKEFKAAQYFDTDLEWTDEEKMAKANLGKKYEYRESWGEQIVEAINPVICVLDLVEKKIEVYDSFLDGISPSQTQWAPNDSGVIFYGMKTDPYRLGSIFCDNRPGQLFFYDFKTSLLEKLSDADVAIVSTKASPAGKYVTFFQREAKGPHQDGFALMGVFISCTSLYNAVFRLIGSLIVQRSSKLFQLFRNANCVNSQDSFPPLSPDVLMLTRIISLWRLFGILPLRLSV